MSKPMLKLAVMAATGVAVVVAVREYNTLIKSRREVMTAYADMDKQIERRHDTVRALIEHLDGKPILKKDTLVDLVDAETRSAVFGFSYSAMSNRARAEADLTEVLRALFTSLAGAVSTSENIISLQEQLSAARESDILRRDPLRLSDR